MVQHLRFRRLKWGDPEKRLRMLPQPAGPSGGLNGLWVPVAAFLASGILGLLLFSFIS